MDDSNPIPDPGAGNVLAPAHPVRTSSTVSCVITPEEVDGMVGISLVPDTPEAQQRVHDAFASIGRGVDTSGVVLELRRKNDGEPLFIEWWSRT